MATQGLREYYGMTDIITDSLQTLNRERRAKYQAIDGLFQAFNRVFPGYECLIDFESEHVVILKDNEKLKTISIWGDNARACFCDVMLGLTPIVKEELA